MIRSFLIATALAVGLQAAPVPTITLSPSSGSVSGAPGSVVGWGFSLNYSATSDWVVLTGSSFTGSPVYGNYVDYLSLATAPLYVAGPAPEGATVTQPWNSATQLGLGAFKINLTALPGSVTTGNIVIHYSLFSVDPNNSNFDPNVDTVVADATVSDAVSITVPASTPEPASLALVGLAALSIFFLKRIS